MDALTGCKISSIDIGVPVIRMSYSPTSGHSVIAILEVGAPDAFLFSVLDIAVASCIYLFNVNMH